jgi:DNA-binding NarL/FixJ family response regulator
MTAPPAKAEEDGMATQANDGLLPREREVLQLVARGKANREIAAALGMAAATVKGHLESIYQKYRVSNRTEAVVEWLRRMAGAE